MRSIVFLAMRSSIRERMLARLDRTSCRPAREAYLRTIALWQIRRTYRWVHARDVRLPHSRRIPPFTSA
jgi:hypothetical protein